MATLHRAGDRRETDGRPWMGWLLSIVAAVLLSSVLPFATRASTVNPESGLPMIHVFRPSDYSGGGQNWALAQDARGVIYVGNGEDGVLEFDGVRWRRVVVPNRTVRSLAMGEDGRLYVGTQGEFGYLEPDAVGTLQYRSLVDLIPEDARDFADVWHIHVIGKDVYFSTPQALFRLRDGRIRAWRPENRIHLTFAVRGRVYARRFGEGLYRLDGDEFTLLPGGERFADERIYAMLPWVEDGGPDRGEMLIGTRTQGWLLFDGKNYRPWKTQIDEALEQRLLYAGRWLSNGDLALATLEGGLALLDRDGKQRLHLDRSSGLGDDISYTLLEDQQRGLWVGLGAGVARVATGSSLSMFDERNGLVGAVLAIHRHRGQLYVGTHSGLFRLVAEPGANARFEQVPGLSNMTWAFLDFEDRLLVSNLKGLFEIRNGHPPRRIIETDGETMALLRSKTDPDRVFVGSGLGMTAIRLRHGAWVQEPLKLAIGSGTYSLAEDAQGRIWMGTQGVHVHRLSFPGLRRGEPLPPVVMERFGAAEGLPGGLTYISRIGGEIAFGSTTGILRFDDRRRRFEPAPEFATLFGSEVRQVGPLTPDARGRVWMYTVDGSRQNKQSGVAIPDRNGRYRWDGSTLAPLAGHTLIAIHADDDGVAWLGSETALYRYSPMAAAAPTDAFHAHVRRILGRNGSVLYGGAGPLPELQLAHDDNALRFEFAAPSFDHHASTQYQVWLEGVDAGWSEWSTEGYRDYTKIPIGTHAFRIRARDVYGRISEEARIEFRLLPPWYLTWWAFLAYFVAGIALLWSVFQWRSSALRKRNAELADLVARRTEELSGANDALQEANRALAEQSATDPLTGLKNRRHVMQRMAVEVAAVDRQHHPGHTGERTVLLFLLIDIDHFKEVNDRYGHAAGDRVLEQFRDILLKVARRTDITARWGGEEFLVVAHAPDVQAGARFAERIRAEVAAHVFEVGETQIHRTCSIGFAAYPFFPTDIDGRNWEQVLHFADQCLYAAKRGGRDAWVGVAAREDAPDPDTWAWASADLEDLTAAGFVRWYGSKKLGLPPP